MVALTGQAWDRETLRGAQRAARTQSEPPRWADCPWDPWVDLSTPQAQRGLLLHPGADLSRPKAHSGAASSLMGRSQWSPGPDKGCQPPSHADFLCYPLADLSRPQAQRVLPLHPWEGLSRPQAQRGLPLHPWRFGSGSPCTLLTSGFKAQTHWKHSVPTSETSGACKGGPRHTAG